jgi:hypothetical protein
MLGTPLTRKIARFLETEAVEACYERQEREEDELLRQQIIEMDSVLESEFGDED